MTQTVFLFDWLVYVQWDCLFDSVVRLFSERCCAYRAIT